MTAPAEDPATQCRGSDLREKDIIEAFEIEQIAATLDAAKK